MGSYAPYTVVAFFGTVLFQMIFSCQMTTARLKSFWVSSSSSIWPKRRKDHNQASARSQPLVFLFILSGSQIGTVCSWTILEDERTDI